MRRCYNLFTLLARLVIVVGNERADTSSNPGLD